MKKLENPWLKVELWLQDAQAKIAHYDRMSIATANKQAKPSVRTVLFKGIKNESILWYSNTISQKGQEIEENPQAEVLFYWFELGRQLRLAGEIKKLSKEQTKEYFLSRSFESQIVAFTSKQSQEIEKGVDLNQLYEQNLKKYSSNKNNTPMPEYWQGYQLLPNKIEFWQDGIHRLHTRLVYQLDLQNPKQWKSSFLYP